MVAAGCGMALPSAADASCSIAVATRPRTAAAARDAFCASSPAESRFPGAFFGAEAAVSVCVRARGTVSGASHEPPPRPSRSSPPPGLSQSFRGKEMRRERETSLRLRSDTGT